MATTDPSIQANVPAVVVDIDEGEAAPPPEPENDTLTPAQHRQLRRMARFILGMQAKHLFHRAEKEGYTIEEHKSGWKLLRVAGGEDRPAEQYMQEVSLGGGETTGEQLAN